MYYIIHVLLLLFFADFDLPSNDMTFGVDNSRLLGPLAAFRARGDSGLMISDWLPELSRRRLLRAMAGLG